MLALLSVDYKFIFIPLAFIFLRLWSFVGDVLHLYIGKTTLNEGFSFTLIVLGVSVMNFMSVIDKCCSSHAITACSPLLE